MAIADYNTDPDLNVDISGINIAEGCPPSGINNAIRQMMADVKTADNENVKLSGSQTVDGVKTFTSDMITRTIRRNAENDGLILLGGTDNTSSRLVLYGKTHPALPGCFRVEANDGNGAVYLQGQPNGKLLWNGKDIAIDDDVVHKTGNETIAGTKTFSATIAGNAATATKLATARSLKVKLDSTDAVTFDGSAAQNAIPVTGTLAVGHGGTGMTSLATFVQTSGDQTIAGVKTFTSDVVADTVKMSVDNSGFIARGGKDSGSSALVLYGKSQGALPGCFTLRATKTSQSAAKELRGQPDGTLQWNGQPVQTTSDERLKTPLAPVPDAILDAWGDVGWGQFNFLEAIAEKGNKARLHLGLIAQRVKAVFEAHGLDACDYGILCYAQDDDLWMVRYTEALSMEAAYQRRRADRAEARLADIERRLAALEDAE